MRKRKGIIESPEEFEVTKGDVASGKSRARLNPRHQSMVREKIRTTLIVNRLQAFALGEKIGTRRVIMTSDQVNAAKILLGKSLPDLNRTEVVGDPNQPIEVALRKAEELARLEDPTVSAAHYQDVIGALH